MPFETWSVHDPAIENICVMFGQNPIFYAVTTTSTRFFWSPLGELDLWTTLEHVWVCWSIHPLTFKSPEFIEMF